MSSDEGTNPAATGTERAYHRANVGLLGSGAVGGAAFGPAGTAAFVVGQLGQFLSLREQRLRLQLELEARRAALEGRLRELEIQREANRTYLEAQCRDRADAREVVVALARDLIAATGQVLRASAEATGPEAIELRKLAQESLAAAVAVIREKFPAGALAVIAD